MNKQVLKILGNIIALFLGAKLFAEVSVMSTSTIIMAGVALWAVNLIIAPLLKLVTIPINILTLGLFSLVINTWMVMLVDKIIEGLYIRGFWPAFGLAILVAFINVLLEKIVKSK